MVVRTTKHFMREVRNILTERGCSQVTLARRMRASPAQVSRWLNGQTVPRLDTALRLLSVTRRLAGQLDRGVYLWRG